MYPVTSHVPLFTHPGSPSRLCLSRTQATGQIETTAQPDECGTVMQKGSFTDMRMRRKFGVNCASRGCVDFTIDESSEFARRLGFGHTQAKLKCI